MLFSINRSFKSQFRKGLPSIPSISSWYSEPSSYGKSSKLFSYSSSLFKFVSMPISGGRSWSSLNERSSMVNDRIVPICGGSHVSLLWLK